MTIRRVGLIFAVFLAMTVHPQMATADSMLESEKQRVVKLVEEAVTVVNAKGRDAFSIFYKKGTMWRKGETYIFIGNSDGVMLFNASSGGENIIDPPDARQRPHRQAFVKTITTKGSGWVKYMWPKPGQKTPAKKMSYVKKAKLGDKIVFVGSGIYY